MQRTPEECELHLQERPKGAELECRSPLRLRSSPGADSVRAKPPGPSPHARGAETPEDNMARRLAPLRQHSALLGAKKGWLRRPSELGGRARKPGALGAVHVVRTRKSRVSLRRVSDTCHDVDGQAAVVLGNRQPAGPRPPRLSLVTGGDASRVEAMHLEWNGLADTREAAGPILCRYLRTPRGRGQLSCRGSRAGARTCSRGGAGSEDRVRLRRGVRAARGAGAHRALREPSVGQDGRSVKSVTL